MLSSRVLFFGDATPIKCLADVFCGRVVLDASDIHEKDNVYVAGDVSAAKPVLSGPFKIIIEHSSNYTEDDGELVSMGQVPRIIPGIGVFYPQFFDTSRDWFKDITDAHPMHQLTESTKPASVSYRKGVYITDVTRTGEDEFEYKLLRCSTNFSEPTENCRMVDHVILSAINTLAAEKYTDFAPINHVLAQVYTNSTVDGKEKKARIPAHSDKTKDMPANALMAFVTFYDAPVSDDHALTRMVWKSKTADKRVISVTLYPNSVLLVDMETNRNFCHEISPSILPVARIPTRLGYVARCSKTTAVWRDGTTYIKTPSEDIPLRRPTEADVMELKDQYWRENANTDIVTYADVVPYSLNAGDYMAPRV